MPNLMFMLDCVAEHCCLNKTRFVQSFYEEKLIKTVWVETHTKQKGKWEEYDELTGDVKTGMFGGQKPVKVKKKRWVPIPNEYIDHQIDGARVSQDLELALNQLEADGFHILAITPVVSGRYNWQQYHTRRRPGNMMTDSPDTAVSWGYSVTEGFTIVAKKI